MHKIEDITKILELGKSLGYSFDVNPVTQTQRLYTEQTSGKGDKFLNKLNDTLAELEGEDEKC